MSKKSELEAKIEEVVSRLKRMSAKQKLIEEKMYITESTLKSKDIEE